MSILFVYCVYKIYAVIGIPKYMARRHDGGGMARQPPQFRNFEINPILVGKTPPAVEMINKLQ